MIYYINMVIMVAAININIISTFTQYVPQN